MTAAIALLDLDGTVADYDGAAYAALRKLASPADLGALDAFTRDEEPSWLKARRALVTRQPGFWRGLPELPLGMAIYELLKELGFEIHVLTKGPTSKTKSRAWTEKVEWCREHLPGTKVTITEDKSLTYGRVLVDDWPEYFMPWMQHRPRGLVVVPAQPWNRGKVPPNAVRVSAKGRREPGDWAASDESLRNMLTRARDRKDGEPLWG